MPDDLNGAVGGITFAPTPKRKSREKSFGINTTIFPDQRITILAPNPMAGFDDLFSPSRTNSF